MKLWNKNTSNYHIFWALNCGLIKKLWNVQHSEQLRSHTGSRGCKHGPKPCLNLPIYVFEMHLCSCPQRRTLESSIIGASVASSPPSPLNFSQTWFQFRAWYQDLLTPVRIMGSTGFLPSLTLQTSNCNTQFWLKVDVLVMVLCSRAFQQ